MKTIMRSAVAATLLFVLTAAMPAVAEPVQAKYKGLRVNGELSVPDGASLANGVALLVHGTLAHHRMEIIATVQDLLTERGIPSLAISLSLGVDDRKGMYDCATTHRHKHTDALDEIDFWLDWLSAKGAGPVTIFGHSRGGNQVAWFMSERDRASIRSAVLLAPATFSFDRASASCKDCGGGSLSGVLAELRGLPPTALVKRDLLYCPGSEVEAASYLSYYSDDPRKDTPTILPKIAKPVTVVAGTADTVVKGLIPAVKPLVNDRIELVVVEGADHFFRDLYAEDVADAVARATGAN